MENSLIDVVGTIAAVCVPLFNIPLIVKIIKTKSSKDLSLVWVVGVWVCFVLMAPSGLKSADTVWRTFNIANLSLFTFVMIVAVKYRKGPQS